MLQTSSAFLGYRFAPPPVTDEVTHARAQLDSAMQNLLSENDRLKRRVEELEAHEASSQQDVTNALAALQGLAPGCQRVASPSPFGMPPPSKKSAQVRASSPMIQQTPLSVTPGATSPRSASPIIQPPSFSRASSTSVPAPQSRQSLPLPQNEWQWQSQQQQVQQWQQQQQQQQQ